MPAPFEIVNGPVTLYTGMDGTPPPEISVPPPNPPWSVLGHSGARSYSDDGVTITPERSYENVMVLGSTAPQKSFLSEQGFMFTVNLVDMTVETLARAMNGAAITEVAAGVGSGGYRAFDLMIEDNASLIAVVIRGRSPYGDGMFAQHWVPRCQVVGVGEYSYTKAEGTMLEVEFSAMEHPTFGFGRYIGQFAPPS